METLTLSQYKIYLGPVAEAMAAFWSGRTYSQLLVLVDENTERHCLPRLLPHLPDLPRTIIRTPAGEIHKNLDTCRLIWQRMIDACADRRALAVNLGGGVAGDMGGFCAATYKRGIDFIQVPTTLLAQVDASVGSKLGIDFGPVKNSIGVFCDPQAVLIDPAFLATLPPRELRSGLAEIIKHALIADAAQWTVIRTLDNLGEADWPLLIGPSLRIKRCIVEADPREQGLRKALNFGHTIGHAVEGFALRRPDPLLHGEAVAIGMVCEAFLSHRLLGLSLADTEDISRFVLHHYGHYHLNPAHFKQFLQLMSNDKKNEGRQINFSLLPSIGTVQINCTAESSEIEKSLLFYNELQATVS